MAADCPIFNVFTMPEVITLVPHAPFDAQVVVEALRVFPQFDGVAA